MNNAGVQFRKRAFIPLRTCAMDFDGWYLYSGTSIQYARRQVREPMNPQVLADCHSFQGYCLYLLFLGGFSAFDHASRDSPILFLTAQASPIFVLEHSCGHDAMGI